MNNVIILGAGRSGTSAIAGSFVGNFNRGGNLHPANDANPKGFFEANFVNRINDDLLWSCKEVETTRGLKQGWLTSLDKDVLIMSDSKDIEDRIESVCSNNPILLKDPRFSYTLPVWLRYINDPKIICVFRDPREFLSSMMHHCATQQYLKGMVVDSEFFQKVWLSMYTYILKNYLNLNMMFINYKDILEGDGLKRLSDYTGYLTDNNFPEKGLRRSNNNQEVAYNLTEMYSRLCSLASIRYQYCNE
jgi:hypothetical protein